MDGNEILVLELSYADSRGDWSVGGCVKEELDTDMIRW